MGINFGSFIGGLAKSLDERLQDDMRRTAERSDRVREYHVTRAARKEERFEEEQKELQEVLQNLSSYMDKAGIEIPEGMTKADFAAQLYTTGGGTLSSGKQLVADLDEHYKKKGDIKGLINQASLVTQGKGFGDYINNFVRRPDTMIKIPENLRGGVGFLKDVDITKGIQDETDAMLAREKQPEKFDVKGLGFDRSKMIFAEKYEKEQKATDLAIEKAEADIKKTLADAKVENAFTRSGFESRLEKIKRAKADATGIQLDTAGNIDIKTAREKKIDISKFQTEIVETLTKSGLDATGTFMDGRNLSLVVQQASVKDDKGNYLIQINKPPETAKDLSSGKVYNMKKKGETTLSPHIYIGPNIDPIPLY
jgi:hypothetical protein